MGDEARHASIDGSAVTIETDVLDPRMHASSVGVYTVDDHWQEFTASYRDFGAAVADDLGVRLSESYRFQGGALRLGSGTVSFPAAEGVPAQRDLIHVGVWEGREHSVHTHLYNGAAHDLVAIFERFHIVEETHGIHLYPKEPQHTVTAKEPTVLREVRNIGLLQITPLTPRVARTLPKWRGTAVAGGELFVGGQAETLHFLLVGARSHTLVMRGDDDCSDEEVTRIGQLRVDWQPGATSTGN